MATVKERTTSMTATAAELRQRADAARRIANRAAEEAEAKVKAVWRDAQGDDWVKKLRAESALPALRVTAAEARAVAIEADTAWRATAAAHSAERAEHHRPLIEAKRRELIDALDAARRVQTELWSLALTARQDDGGAAFDLSDVFSPLGGCDVTATQFDAWRERERRRLS